MDNNQKIDKNSFIKHMFEDDDNKPKILNIIQYAVTGLIPLILLNRLMQNIFPEVNEEKNNIELSVEIVSQITLLFVGVFFIDKFIRYFKSYSGEKYDDISVLSMILPLMLILISIPSKLGEKIKILIERILVYLNIESSEPKHNEEHVEEEQYNISQQINTPTVIPEMKPTLEPEITRKVSEGSSTLISHLHNSSQSNGRVSNTNSLNTQKNDLDTYVGSQYSLF